jgi:hypothetical protein
MTEPHGDGTGAYYVAGRAEPAAFPRLAAPRRYGAHGVAALPERDGDGRASLHGSAINETFA